MDEFDEIVREFLVESYENLDQLDRDLVALEQEPDAHPLLQSIFRTIHTIKGTSGFLAFGKLEVLTHAGEGLLAGLRDGGLRLTQERTTGLLELVDAVRSILASIEATGVEDHRDYTSLVARLTALQTSAPDTELASASAAVASGASAVTRSRARQSRLPVRGVARLIASPPGPRLHQQTRRPKRRPDRSPSTTSRRRVPLARPAQVRRLRPRARRRTSRYSANCFSNRPISTPKTLRWRCSSSSLATSARSARSWLTTDRPRPTRCAKLSHCRLLRRRMHASAGRSATRRCAST